MNQEKLLPGLIDSPGHHRLLLRVEEEKALDVLIYSPSVQGSLIFRHIDLAADQGANPVKSLEQAIYDNPLLVEGDFESVHCNLADTAALALPPGLTPAQTDLARNASRQLAGAMEWAGESSGALPGGAVLHYAARPETVNFLRRTFYGITLHPLLEPLARYFGETSQRGNDRKIYVNFRRGHIDVIALSRSETLLVNSYACATPSDAAYYILAATELGGFSRQADAIVVAGDSDLREGATELLRRFVRRVMPLLFPSAMFTAGRDAMLAPFDLIALALKLNMSH